MITYKFMGQVPNNQILKFYGEHDVNCFVMPSEMEGLPVSIMEAESAGIPIIATDVGGIREMIDGNGILLPSNPSAEEIAYALIKVLGVSDTQKSLMRAKSNEIWKNLFDAKNNSIAFVKFIEEQLEYKGEKIFFFTEGYPYTDNEKSFLEEELKELLRHYDVTIIARINGRMTDENASVARSNIDSVLKCVSSDYKIESFAYEDSWSIPRNIFRIIGYFFDGRTRLERKDIFQSGEKFGIRIWESIKYYCRAQMFYRWMVKNNVYHIIPNEQILIYSYWNLQPVLGTCFNRRVLGNPKIITRAHGYDYQDEQWPNSRRKPFMKTIDKMIDAIVFVSESGKKYHVHKHGGDLDSKKYYVSYIGSNSLERAFSNNQQPVISDLQHGKERFLVASCSSLIPLKRVYLIIDALQIVAQNMEDIEIEWVHFGDGPLRADLEEKARTLLK
ncbi:glycosyltransferase [Butyrivibrio sp. AE2032]|uniref:glycosyltransferase n=1 Tax=Butyrivibrio sp. AE2032 TaxID=1458463 RepID=UPI00054D2EC0|nr:glycosyltransferase [Butyrivibrio sp. AE2032]